MKRSIVMVCILLLGMNVKYAAAGYTIVQIPRIDAEYVVAQGPKGPVSRRNPGSWQRPASGVRRIYRDISGLYGDDPTRRVELWETTDGTATDVDIFAACPGLRDHVAALIRAEGAARLLAVASPYTPAERETWSVQIAEAEAWTADHAAATPMIDAICAGRGTEKSVLVGYIMDLNSRYRAACGAILGRQQALLERVYAATTVNDLLAITWADSK